MEDSIMDSKYFKAVMVAIYSLAVAVIALDILYWRPF
jgi:hypothetical protein